MDTMTLGINLLAETAEEAVDLVFEEAFESRLLPSSLVEQLPQIVTSHSIDGTFESCPRRFEFMHVWKRSPEREKGGFAADVGTALHEATQAWARVWLAPGVEQTPELKRRARDKGYFELLRWWPWSLEIVQKESGKQIGERTLGNAILLYEKIIAWHEWNEWELLAIDGFGLSIEVPWLIVHTSIGTVPTPYGLESFFSTQGKIDFLLRNKFTGEIRVFDLKTTVKDANAHDAAFRFSGQGGFYSLVLGHALGFDWRKHGLSMTYLVAYFGTLEKDMSVEPWTYPYGPDELEDAIATKVDRLTRMATFARARYWPRRQHGCDFYGTPCGYLDICQLRNANRIKDWFAFEVDKRTFVEYNRTYAPVWVMQA